MTAPDRKAVRVKYWHRFPLSAEPMIDLGKPLTLVGAKRYESARDKWAKRTVLIYSIEHGAFWRPGAAGYTQYVDAAGRYPFSAAYGFTSDLDRRKRVVFYRAPS